MSGDLREPVDYAAVQRLWDSIGWQLEHQRQEPDRDRLRRLFGTGARR
ncbi:hypothetical protein SEA_HAMMY_86 [Mycobacterium phage Hammy]|uniref:Uncharacterized protein n=2 Tax=Amginevirus TaxID=2946794 RepID=A0A222ZNP9_9CAUD|nr:hypothetical protein I5G85_gp13 [Mycobacterium phage Amohnition]YP_009952044.1 hypothetical protein I5G86_gp13 [Mycobacterium phage DarthP]APD18248.1 hypothetical protein SEA_HAMMY_86 [Mycobacterium phage Hammy]ASR86366.1 hypothetical protein SEA_AMOHNITION_86 [Mycobacterium phage Amohnition]ASW31832.1 hypothetical protein SEA_DARTHP_86 [Mycobacterium phage DarthP]